ncbi:hypothetical protein QUB80_30510 [Chlorogloeopsis sp. ULAP01]|uniref:hypothetical protein n=1 Tax=Chlorogloeopsis sp. ULAP01 TaxID=3056483 RepID=UPI0025AA8249|nr:hypothetical protein [Chlorogloeopsis sp. ULAP01]MDM9384993.1 hypothetical protein [Chlorogloeopsis sp. ULAP01]
MLPKVFMETDDTRDFAERFKKFYYSRALLCENLISGRIGIEADNIQMPPKDYNPFNTFYTEAYVVACAALDGLSSNWQVLYSPAKTQGGNQRLVLEC